MKPNRYRVTYDRIIRGEIVAKKDDTVYDNMKYDYGLADEDTRVFGAHHISVTHNPDGDYPFFTIPYAQLEPF